MLYLGLFTWRANDGDDIKAPGLFYLPIVEIMIDSSDEVTLLLPIDSLQGTEDFIRTACLYLYEHQPLAVLCNNVDVAMTRMPITFQNNISLFT